MVYNENGIILNESFFKSKLKDDFIKKPEANLNDFNRVSLEEFFKREYTTFDKFLEVITLGCSFLLKPRIKKFADYSDDKKFKSLLKGCAFYDNDNKIVGVVQVFTQVDGTNHIEYLELVRKYKGMGLSKQLLDIAVKEFEGVHLSVDNDNEVAISVYKKYGFVPHIIYGNSMQMILPNKIQKINFNKMIEIKLDENNFNKLLEKYDIDLDVNYLGYEQKTYLYKYAGEDQLILQINYSNTIFITFLNKCLDTSIYKDAISRGLELGANKIFVPKPDSKLQDICTQLGMHIKKQFGYQYLMEK